MIEAIQGEGAARRAIANVKERHKKRALLQIERLKRFGGGAGGAMYQTGKNDV